MTAAQIPTTTKDLGYGSDTLKDKQTWLTRTLQEKDALLATGNANDKQEAWFRLGSVCHSIIGNCKARESTGDSDHAWQQLMLTATTNGREALDEFPAIPSEDLRWSDCEVWCALQTDIDPENSDAMTVALKMLLEALPKAHNQGSAASGLAYAQIVRMYVHLGQDKKVSEFMHHLFTVIQRLQMPHMTTKPHRELSRMHRASAEGSKFLARIHAGLGNSPDQVRKAAVV